MNDAVLPKLKHMTPAFPGDGIVYVGGYGQVAEIPDETGAIRRLFELLDGTRTIPQVHHDLAADHPEVTLDEVREAITQFDEAGFLINEAVTPDGLLDDYELARWERNVNFFGSFCGLADNKYAQQRKLLDARVTLLGLGGLGSHILLDLAAMGVGHVRVVEFDRVELSNLNRQILYRDSDVGQPKIDLAVERVRLFNPRIQIEKVPRKIESTQDVLAAVSDADVVISVADRPKMEINHWVNEGCVRAGVPLITGGLDTQRAVYYTIIPGTTGCIECWRLGVFRSDEVSATLLAEKRERQIGGDNAAFVPLVTLTTGLLIAEFVRLVTGIAPPVAAGRLIQLGFGDSELTEYERWERLPDCPVCGPAAQPSPTSAATATSTT
ncbi:HesA/MoeB/ThiF family protein [Goodfellowiella coeruleoviolacea]|uniref:Molybdopterin or thiamine biosynthesis adenylyltransferase n=1 Tax=Goodfellowiella coeruleoviolacea TaxID=334858 RepID=A0AAE3GJH7_9PSEU|nr:ThiF family adenylyltransferase [Goodfellowiella coeruleoviolacea]MCP2168494.1 Molybdopterin or thiamine biosynthesis adenylyltransferase [Goodfellowiella coeruleoviolacea]